MWKVSKGGRAAYVLGESLPRTVDWQDPDVQALLTNCGRLWTETNQTYRESTDALVKKFGMSADASPLGALSTEQMARLRAAAVRTQTSLGDLAGARPWLVGATLEDAGYRAAGLNGRSASTTLRAQAIAGGIPVSTEFPLKDDVFAWFGEMTPDEDAQFLCYAVDGVLLGLSGSEQISSAWASGRPGPAARFVEHERRDYPALYRKLTLARNRSWLPRFELMTKDAKPALVVVGLYHLVGPDSLLVLLQQAGFTVSKGI